MKFYINWPHWSKKQTKQHYSNTIKFIIAPPMTSLHIFCMTSTMPLLFFLSRFSFHEVAGSLLPNVFIWGFIFIPGCPSFSFFLLLSSFSWVPCLQGSCQWTVWFGSPILSVRHANSLHVFVHSHVVTSCDFQRLSSVQSESLSGMKVDVQYGKVVDALESSISHRRSLASRDDQ